LSDVRESNTMRDFIRNHRKAAAVAAALISFVLSSVVWSLSASIRGRTMAHFDTARGHYYILGYGLPVQWRSDYARLLRERYGIEFRAVAGCTVSNGLVAYVDSYDRVSTTAANAKFGHDVFKECAQEAQRTWVSYNLKSAGSIATAPDN
jgi:hypothetical protein